MDWPKDRKEAFLWAAEAFGTPENKRTARQREISRLGICHAISKLTCSNDVINWACDLGKLLRIKKAYWWPARGHSNWTPTCDDERSLFCIFMAVLSKKEFEEISG